mmetsp:Transcript_55316/g.154061  ORF Transcript_55316/g.154061 Transcript_55316/m.154061 type:complete len:278 (+) Transcript_55316:257-1090(+)
MRKIRATLASWHRTGACADHQTGRIRMSGKRSVSARWESKINGLWCAAVEPEPIAASVASETSEVDANGGNTGVGTDADTGGADAKASAALAIGAPATLWALARKACPPAFAASISVGVELVGGLVPRLVPRVLVHFNLLLLNLLLPLQPPLFHGRPPGRDARGMPLIESRLLLLGGCLPVLLLPFVLAPLPLHGVVIEAVEDAYRSDQQVSEPDVFEGLLEHARVNAALLKRRFELRHFLLQIVDHELQGPLLRKASVELFLDLIILHRQLMLPRV